MEASGEGEAWAAIGVEGEVFRNILHQLDSENQHWVVRFLEPQKATIQRDDVPVLTASPAVSAAVVLRDVFFHVLPDIDRRENQGDQHGEAAQQGKVGDALLLALG